MRGGIAEARLAPEPQLAHAEAHLALPGARAA
jgi:hypothetical protein